MTSRKKQNDFKKKIEELENTSKDRGEVPEGAEKELNRNTPEKARWTDLFTGEAAANRNTVDVSRLQHMVITVLLLSSYLVMLVEYSRSIDALAVIVALLTGEPVFAEMPPVDQTFVGLLVVSHGSYLVYKTRSLAIAAPGAGDQQS